MRKQIEIKSPVRAKDLEGRFHVLFKTLVGADGSRRELFDTYKNGHSKLKERRVYSVDRRKKQILGIV